MVVSSKGEEFSGGKKAHVSYSLLVAAGVEFLPDSLIIEILKREEALTGENLHALSQFQEKSRKQLRWLQNKIAQVSSV